MHRHPSVTAMHYLARALLLAGFAFFIVHLVRAGDLDLYIASRMQFIVKCSALGLYAVAAQQFYSAIRSWLDGKNHDPSCDCQHEMPATWGRSLLLYGWFALPLIIGFAVPDGLLGSSMASAKGVQFTPQQIVKPYAEIPPAAPDPTVIDPAVIELPIEKDDEDEIPVAELSDDALDLLFPTDAFTESYARFGRQLVDQDLIQVTDKQFIETLTTLDLYRTAFIGKNIQLSGFVYREGSMGQQQFGVSRFAISCCSADASPYGVMAKFGKASEFATDEWVTVTGKLSTALYNDIEIIQIDVTKITKISPPEDPYVTQDLDFGLE
ncbi:TIGR03943 family putative permease subunit [Cohnella lupini]|uniref:Putative repeat protein (TIGR03943 family) n=1 Tax=Cohnella lupini TaxID=1294267 RepID=A0A3D9I6F0_9BACL|nr:TIGR03943 family protein [Cohnella lupini]RED57225.1 putative repeat protein (TIGR03943 family) [Cohnella lupini]